jgi:hypothetical protein
MAGGKQIVFSSYVDFLNFSQKCTPLYDNTSHENVSLFMTVSRVVPIFMTLFQNVFPNVPIFISLLCTPF